MSVSIGARLGDVQVFQPFPEAPMIVFGRVAARSAAFGPLDAAGGAPVVIGSAAGTDREDVTARARGELVERVSNVLAGRLAEHRGVVATYDDLRRRCTPAVDAAAWGGAALRRVSLLWVTGRSLTTGAETLVPAGAAFLRHRPPVACGSGPSAGSAGLAAHVSADAAVRHALLEVLERDLIARSWYAAAGRARVTDEPAMAPPVADALAALGLRSTLLELPGPGSTACLVACLYADGRRQQSFGARAIDGLRGEGVERAVFEALMIRWSMATPVARRAEAKLVAENRPGPGDALEHALWTFYRQDSLTHWLDRLEPVEAPYPQSTVAAGSLPLPSLVADHTEADVVVVDSTVAGVTPPGLSVVRVVAPGARTLPMDERSVSRAGSPHPFG